MFLNSNIYLKKCTFTTLFLLEPNSGHLFLVVIIKYDANAPILLERMLEYLYSSCSILVLY